MDNNVSALAFHDRQCEKSYLDIESERLRVEIFKKIQRGNRVRDADHVGAKKKKHASQSISYVPLSSLVDVTQMMDFTYTYTVYNRNDSDMGTIGRTGQCEGATA